MRPARVVGVLGAALSLWLLVLIGLHASRPVYDLPPTGVAFGVAAALGSALGWILVARSDDGIVLGLAFAALLPVGGIIAIFSIGLLLLLGFVGVVVALSRAASRRADRDLPRAAFVASVLVGLGLPLAAIAATDGPIVRCHAHGVSGSESVLRSFGFGGGSRGSSSSVGSASSTSGGTAGGGMTSNGRSYSYRCEGDRLVEFRAVDG